MNRYVIYIVIILSYNLTKSFKEKAKIREQNDNRKAPITRNYSKFSKLYRDQVDKDIKLDDIKSDRRKRAVKDQFAETAPLALRSWGHPKDLFLAAIRKHQEDGHQPHHATSPVKNILSYVVRMM